MLGRFALQLGLCGLILGAPAAFAQLPAPPRETAPDSTTLRQASDRLAAIVNPDSAVEGQVDRIVEGTLASVFASETGLAKLEETYPGMRDAVGAAMKPLVAAHAMRAMPLHRAELSQLYQMRLTVAEADQAAAFMVSPVMVKFIASARANMDFKNVVKSLLAEKGATTGDMRRDLTSAGTKSAEALSLAEQNVILGFMVSPVGQKLNALSGEKLAIDTKWANYSEPLVEQEIEALVMNAMVSHIALTDPDVAQAMQEELAKPQTPVKQ